MLTGATPRSESSRTNGIRQPPSMKCVPTRYRAQHRKLDFPHPRLLPLPACIHGCIHPFLQVFEFFGKFIQFSKPNAIIRVQSYIVGHNIPGGIRRHARTSPPSRDSTHPNTSKPPSFTMGMYGCIYGWDRNK